VILTRWYHRWTQLSWETLCASAVYLSSTRALRNSCYANQPGDYIYIQDQGLFLGLCYLSFKSLNLLFLNCLHSCITTSDSQEALFSHRCKIQVELWGYTEQPFDVTILQSGTRRFYFPKSLSRSYGLMMKGSGFYYLLLVVTCTHYHRCSWRKK
jgi:hypothetical protein